MRFRQNVERALSEHQRIAVWGAGSLGALAMEDWLPKGRVVAVLDSDPSKQGKVFFGHTITNPAVADFAGYDAVVVCITAYLEAFRVIAERNAAVSYFYVYELVASPRSDTTELDHLAVDYHRIRNKNLLLTLLTRPQFLTVATYRLTRYCAASPMLGPLFYVAVFFHRLTCAFSKIELPHTVKAGPGLLFAHLGGAVLNRSTVLGAFVSIYQFTTLGSDDEGGVPRLGDFVTVNAGAVVLGATVIGDHSRVGANATVLGARCEPGSVLVGTPARVVRTQPVLPLAERLKAAA